MLVKGGTGDGVLTSWDYRMVSMDDTMQIVLPLTYDDCISIFGFMAMTGSHVKFS